MTMKKKDITTQETPENKSSVSISRAAENLHTDKGYTIATLEKQVEFDKRRNYHYTNTNNPIDFPTIERCPYDDWKSDNTTLD